MCVNGMLLGFKVDVGKIDTLFKLSAKKGIFIQTENHSYTGSSGSTSYADQSNLC